MGGVFSVPYSPARTGGACPLPGMAALTNTQPEHDDGLHNPNEVVQAVVDRPIAELELRHRLRARGRDAARVGLR